MLAVHEPILETRRLRWTEEADCAAFAQRLAALPALRQAHLALDGPLGAGKTTFVRHLLRALGVSGRIKSPTYTVLEPYALGELSIAHFDFYRFDDAREWEDAGFREVFGKPGLKLSEWPEKAQGVLPAPDLHLCLEVLAGEVREVELHAYSPLGLALLQAAQADAPEDALTVEPAR